MRQCAFPRFVKFLYWSDIIFFSFKGCKISQHCRIQFCNVWAKRGSMISRITYNFVADWYQLPPLPQKYRIRPSAYLELCIKSNSVRQDSSSLPVEWLLRDLIRLHESEWCCEILLKEDVYRTEEQIILNFVPRRREITEQIPLDAIIKQVSLVLPCVCDDFLACVFEG